MERAAELEWIRRFLGHLERETTELADAPLVRPASIYTGVETCEREREALFRSQAVVVGLSCDAPKAGDYFTASIAEVPVVVIRGGDGTIAAFVNLCRHRGGPVARGRGHAEGGRLQCPFHAWTYSTNGDLVATPQAETGFESLDRSQWGLRRLPSREHAGVILVGLEGTGAIDAKERLRGVDVDFRAIDLADYHHFETRASVWACNWKLLLSTFLESYHVFSLHRESVHPWYYSHPMLHDQWGGNLRFPVARRTISELVGTPAKSWRLADHATIQWFVSPNTLFSYTRDYVLMWRFYSPRPDRTEVTTSLYSALRIASEETRARLSKALDGQMRIAGAEDFPLQEEIQRGLESGALPEVVFGRNEVAVIAFQGIVEAGLERARIRKEG